MRVAIVHDYLTQLGGAERVLLALMELFPNAPVFTLLHDPKNLRIDIDPGRIRTSFLQKIPGAKRHHRYFPLLMPLAVEQFDFSQYDIVFSDTHSFTKGIITGPRTMHISYCFTPTRYVWDDCHRYVKEFQRGALFQRMAPAGVSYVRLWDYYAAQRVDQYLTLSHFVAQRIKKYYQRDSLIVPPPVDIDKFKVSETNEGYYLIVSRLMPYKRIDLAIKACESLGRKLKIVGVGPEQKSLEQKIKNNTEMLGFVEDKDLPAIYQGAKALLFPQEEDFGITPLEAAASGKPTIAYASGGAVETIIHGETGVLFTPQTVAGLRKAILEFEQKTFDPQLIRQHAEGFNRERFLQSIEETVHNHWVKYKKEYSTRI